MKLLQKILFVAMIGISFGKADGLQFSDPRGVGAPPVVNNPHGIVVGNCADFIAGANHIYFPANGVQPAIAHIGQLARANTDVDNINSAVTQWYIEAFGGNAGLTEAYGAGHFAAAGLPQMGVGADVIVINVGGGAPPNFAQDFWQEFRTIASTVAGRELLYKILIEIRRIDTAHANQHCYASGTERVGGMSLTVTHHAGNIAFVNKGSMTFDNAHRAQLRGVLEQYYSFLTTLATLPNDPHNPVLQTPHFVDENVINIPGATIANDQFTHIQIPTPGSVAANADIYFPIDGHQPTTPNAVVWSCANIDNRENSPITEWYMKMFGVIPIVHGGHVFVHAGWDNAALAVVQRILMPSAGFNGADIIKDPDSGDLVSREDYFKRNFRRIASTSVGRTLLYRLLIEIRRHQAGGNIGCLENIIPAHGALLIRNGLRSISINWDNGEFYFDWVVGEIGINNSTTSLSSIGKEENAAAGSYDSIINHKLPVDVSLFHEMNHWLHYMRYPNRYENEFNRYQVGIHINGTNFAAIGLPAAMPAGAGVVPATLGALGIYYWGIIGAWANMEVSESKWYAPKSDGTDNELRPDFEEIRNILGLVNAGLPPGLVFYNGDDLSENLYRMCVGLPLRFGYGADEYYEDSRVIDKVLSCCNFWKAHYNFSPKRMRRSGFSYNNHSNVQGMGRCKVLP